MARALQVDRQDWRAMHMQVPVLCAMRAMHAMRFSPNPKSAEAPSTSQQVTRVSFSLESAFSFTAFPTSLSQRRRKEARQAQERSGRVTRATVPPESFAKLRSCRVCLSQIQTAAQSRLELDMSLTPKSSDLGCTRFRQSSVYYA